jgi:hypothetical protein
MSEHTVGELIEAIRSASDLKELKRLVGPSAAEAERAEQRLIAIDGIYERHGWDKDKWPYAVFERFMALDHLQTAFENEYH